MAQNMFTYSVLALLVVSVGVGAKRGCSAFGHSCFGGHGKRSGPLGGSSSNEVVVARNQLGQEETPPHPVYPQTYGLLPSGDDVMIPIRDGGVYDREETARDVMKIKLQNIFKHWVDSYRRQQNDDSYLLDTL